jgi:hypothetical protein
MGGRGLEEGAWIGTIEDVGEYVGREIGGEGAGIGADDGGGTGPLEIKISAQFQNCSAN